MFTITMHDRRARSDQRPSGARGETRHWQIGPRIRIGGTVGKIGQDIKKHLPSVGGMIGSATGIPLGGVLGSTVQAKADGTPAGQQIASDFKIGAENTPIALAGTHLLGNGPDTSGGAGGTAGGGDGSGVPGAGDGGGGSSIPGWVIDGIKAGVPAAFDWIKSHASDILQGAGIADAAYREMQADKYATQAFKMAQDAYNAKAPLRAAGIAGMQAPTGNPFSVNQHTAAYAPPIPMGTSGPVPATGPRPPAGPGVPMGTPVNFGRLTNLVPGQ